MDPSAPRFLITRLSALGDTILSIPVMCALRDQFPHAQIGWIAEPLPSKILADHPDLNFLFTVPKGWLKKPNEVWRLRKSLAAHRFDVVIDPQGLTKSSVAGWFSGAGKRIGFARGDAREIAPCLYHHQVQAQSTYIAHRYLELLRPLGINTTRLEFRLPVDPMAEGVVRKYCKQQDLAGGFALLNVGAGWHSKTWDPSRFALVARQLSAWYAVRSLVVWGSSAEQERAKQVVEEAGTSAVLARSLSIAELKEVTRLATVMVSGDTGPLHLAVALDTPTVSLFGVTPAANLSPGTPTHRTIQKRYDQFPTSRERRSADNSAMSTIQVDDVMAVLGEMLATPRRQAA